jgi:hypothetical protein
MIQLIIHQIWMQDNIAFKINTELGNKIMQINNSIVPDTIKELMIGTVKLNKDFSYILWCESNINDLIKEHYQKYYESFSKMTLIQKIDFAKIIIIHHFGGVYLDCDIEPIKPLNNLVAQLPSDKVIVSEAAKLNYFENNILDKIFQLENTVKINNGALISSKNNDFLLKLCDKIIDRINNKNLGINSIYLTNNSQIDTMRTTGPACITSFVNENKNYDKIVVLNNELFEPCLGSNPFCRETKLSYGKHLHKSMWFADGNFWRVSSLYFYFRRYWFIFVIFIIMFFMFLCKYLKLKMFR